MKKKTPKRKICANCKQQFPFSDLAQDKRLPCIKEHYFCSTCLYDVIEGYTLYCEVCSLPYIQNHAQYKRICAQCYLQKCLKRPGTEYSVIQTARHRHHDKWTSRSLTKDEWIKTLNHFHGMCAYCQVEPYETLEHFVPLKLGGDTTADNCVPACLSCNSYKRGLHPALVTTIPQEDIERVRSYLLSVSRAS